MENIGKNLKGFLYAIVLFALLTLFASIMIKVTPAPESWSIYYMMIALCISCLFLGIYSGNFIKKRGFVYGALYSVIFLLVLSAIFMMAFSTEIGFDLGLIKYLICILFGSIGGMVGVNLRN